MLSASQLKANHPAHYQRFDWTENSFTEWKTIQPGGTVIMEGVTASHQEFQDYVSFGIWIEASANTRLARDGEDHRGNWEKWVAWDEAYANQHHPQDRANLMINGTTNE